MVRLVRKFEFQKLSLKIKRIKMQTKVIDAMSLFVFAISGYEQNGVSLLTPVSDSVLIALSDGTFLFSLHGSFKNPQHKAL